MNKYMHSHTITGITDFFRKSQLRKSFWFFFKQTRIYFITWDLQNACYQKMRIINTLWIVRILHNLTKIVWKREHSNYIFAVFFKRFIFVYIILSNWLSYWMLFMTFPNLLNHKSWAIFNKSQNHWRRFH